MRTVKLRQPFLHSMTAGDSEGLPLSSAVHRLITWVPCLAVFLVAWRFLLVSSRLVMSFFLSFSFRHPSFSPSPNPYYGKRQKKRNEGPSPLCYVFSWFHIHFIDDADFFSNYRTRPLSKGPQRQSQRVVTTEEGYYLLGRLLRFCSTKRMVFPFSRLLITCLVRFTHLVSSGY